MRKLLHLAAALTLLTAATTHAQITNPNDLVAPPPLPIRFHAHPKNITDFQWLWQYTQPVPDGNEAALTADPHFRIMLQNNLTAPQSFFRNGHLPLATVAQHYFGTLDDAVRSTGNRFITLGGCVPDHCESQGLLWIDTAVQHPTLVFAATEWTTESHSITDPNAEFNLWLFSTRPLDAADIPPSLVSAIANWNLIAPQHIQTALLIDPDGTPHAINPAALGATPAAPTVSPTAIK